jgi:hypothetical protein
MRNPSAALLFRNAGPGTFARIVHELRGALPEAEAYLDRLAGEAGDEAERNAAHPGRLLDLVHHTRALSSV